MKCSVRLAVHTCAPLRAISPREVEQATGPEKAKDAFKTYNKERHSSGLEMRERIAAIVRNHLSAQGRLPSARQVARALIPDISVAPPLSIRSIQWHLARIPEVRALREMHARCAARAHTDWPPREHTAKQR